MCQSATAPERKREAAKEPGIITITQRIPGFTMTFTA